MIIITIITIIKIIAIIINNLFKPGEISARSTTAAVLILAYNYFGRLFYFRG